MKIEQIAKICHQANKAYCETLEDYTQPDWGDAPDWQKQSAINGVQFHLDNPKAGPSGSHENWLKEKLENGWKYGSVKNPDLKEHPCCVEYNQLPQEQRLKDSLFTAIVKSLIV